MALLPVTLIVMTITVFAVRKKSYRLYHSIENSPDKTFELLSKTLAAKDPGRCRRRSVGILSTYIWKVHCTRWFAIWWVHHLTFVGED